MSGRKAKNAGYIRHLAHQIVAQLPEENADAIQILEYAKRLILEPPALPEDEPAALRLVEKEGR